MQIGSETEIHLLSILDLIPEEELNIYFEKAKEGHRALEVCQSRIECVEYLLSKEGLGLGKKISDQNAQTILANYCCGVCKNGKANK